jgi:hypothetical protein
MSQSQEAPIWFNALLGQVGPGMRESLMIAHQAVEIN